MKILLIDDNEDLLDLCDTILTSDGYDYTGVDNGKEGLELIRNQKFDVVLLDLVMPEVTGEDVIDALVKEGIMDKQKVVIFTASSATEKEYNPLLEKGVHSIIKKPIDVETLLESMSKISSE